LQSTLSLRSSPKERHQVSHLRVFELPSETLQRLITFISTTLARAPTNVVVFWQTSCPISGCSPPRQ